MGIEGSSSLYPSAMTAAESSYRDRATAPVIVVIPAHNESGRIGATVRSVLPHATEVIVVDDGSSDSTGEEARSAGANVVRLDPGRGYIGAIKAGFQAATGGIIVTVDGDGEHPADAIPTLIAPIIDNDADMTQGARPRVSRPSEAILTCLAGLVAPVGDSGTGMRALRSDLAHSLDIDGRCICGVLTLESIRRGATVIDVPIDLVETVKPRRIAWFHLIQAGPVVREMVRVVWARRRR